MRACDSADTTTRPSNAPVVAQANLDVNGRMVRAQVEAATAHEAIDLLESKMRRRLERVSEHFETRRRDRSAGAQPWRHDSPPTQRPNLFPRVAGERQVVRRKSFTMAPCTVDDAVAEMELLDYDFHLFTEQGIGHRRHALPG